MKNATRWGGAIVILTVIPVIWWITVTSWDSEIAGLYSFNRALFNLAATAIGLSGLYVLLGGKATKEKLQSISLGFAAVAFCLLLFEVPALLFGFDYRTTFRTTAGTTALSLSAGVNKPDPVLVHIHWPHSSFSGEVTGNLVQLGIPTKTRYAANVRYDRNGFRNDRDFDRADIAVIGDSFVEAAIVAREKSLVGQLESRLRVPVVNLGQIDYGLRQELEVLRRFALPLTPKLVVWVFFDGNDLRDVEYYERRVSGPNEPGPPVPLAERLFLRNTLVAAGGLIEGKVRLALQWPSDNALIRSGLFKRADGVTERVYFGQSVPPWTAHQWDVAVDTLSEARRLSTANGAEFVLAYVPRKFRIYRSHITVSPDHYIARWQVNNLPEELGKWCAENGVRFIDLTPYLGDLVARGLHPYFIDDVHWNQLGHETAATAIVEYLSAERIFPFQAGKN